MEEDLPTGERIALPVALVVMVLVFGGCLAAGMPMAGRDRVDRRRARVRPRAVLRARDGRVRRQRRHRARAWACPSTTGC